MVDVRPAQAGVGATLIAHGACAGPESGPGGCGATMCAKVRRSAGLVRPRRVWGQRN